MKLPGVFLVMSLRKTPLFLPLRCGKDKRGVQQNYTNENGTHTKELSEGGSSFSLWKPTETEKEKDLFLEKEWPAELSLDVNFSTVSFFLLLYSPPF